jgi:hypothetical protein
VVSGVAVSGGIDVEVAIQVQLCQQQRSEYIGDTARVMHSGAVHIRVAERGEYLVCEPV